MSFRTFLPALGLLCLFCSSAQAQTLDDTLLTVTVSFDPVSYYDPTIGTSVFVGASYSVQSFGLPQGGFTSPTGCDQCVVFYNFASSFTFVEAEGQQFPCDAPFAPKCYIFRGETGPITAVGHYPMPTTIIISNVCDPFSDPECNPVIALSGMGAIDVFPATPAPTPEPISGSLMAIGFATLALRRHLGRKRGR